MSTYQAHTRRTALLGHTPYSFATFAALIEFACSTRVFSAWNAEQCDYGTDTGWHDGLTDEERDALDEIA
jgi:hypothetical protein